MAMYEKIGRKEIVYNKPRGFIASRVVWYDREQGVYFVELFGSTVIVFCKDGEWSLLIKSQVPNEKSLQAGFEH